MDFVLYEPEKLERNSFGLLEPQGDFTILEPSQIDLIHVPGLAFNTSGYRVGYGGGYYDRYLEHFPGHTISTIYPCQIQNFQPEHYDIPVEEVLIYERNFLIVVILVTSLLSTRDNPGFCTHVSNQWFQLYQRSHLV